MIGAWMFDLMRRKEKGIIKGIVGGYAHPPHGKMRDYLKHLLEEVDELKEAFEGRSLDAVLNEIADLSNCCDLFYERMFILKERGM